jgi:hypothetical protein
MSTAKTTADPTCFGFYTGEAVCTQCKMERRCKSVFQFAGMDILGESLDTAIDQLPATAKFQRSERIPELMQMILQGGAAKPALSKEQADLLAALGG